MQIIRSPEVYDVCVVGSGAGGGMAAKVLTEAGAKVLMLEAGPLFDPVNDSEMLTWSYESPRRGAATPQRQFGEFDAGWGGWTLEGEPYTRTAGTEFDWFRVRMLGGRTNHWGRISLRFGPDDFQRRTLDGHGDDWPISYQDVSPFYDRIDREIGLFGSREGIRNEPDGIFQPPPEPRCHEKLIQKACVDLKIPCIPSRLSILTRPLGSRAACHYCGQCNRGCATDSNFSSPSVLLPPAMATGNLKIIANAMVRKVTTDAEGRATGVSYIDKHSMREYQVRSRIVVLAASACSTARILLNSASRQHPGGLANSSGVVGRYLTDSVGTGVGAFIPRLMNLPPHNDDGVGGGHLYIPWWLDNKKLDFPRGYHIELYGGRGMPDFGFLGGIHRYNGGGYGAKLKEDYRRYYGSFIWLAGRGEMVGRRENYCEIDPSVVDQWGIPVLRFHFRWSDAEYLQSKHMQETIRSIIHQMGGEPSSSMPGSDRGYGIEPGGRIIHELGVVRMGNDPRSSVLNPWCQAHDAKNVFVTDGGPFVSQAHKNPTWTILALALRTSEYIVEERNRGNI